MTRVALGVLSVAWLTGCSTSAPYIGDAGSITADAGSTTADAGGITVDGGGITADAGSVTADAGVVDAGSPITTTLGGVNITLTGGSQAMPFPFATWSGATVKVSPSATGKTYYVDHAIAASGDGSTLAKAFKTIKETLAVVAAGDTVLIAAGMYREVDDLSSVAGSSGKPITYGAYGDGEVIIDGSKAVTGWARVSSGSSVWKASIPTEQVDAVVINDVLLARYKTTTDVPAAGSGQWFQQGTTLYADFGSVDATTADIVVIVNSHGDSTLYLGATSWLNLIGLTIRGSGWAGIWSYPVSEGVGGQHVTVAYCDIKYNDGAGLIFTGGSDSASLFNRVMHNVLNNWPFCSNGNCVSGGGWPGGLGWSNEVNPVARGNVVSFNGGEGIISYGNNVTNGMQSGNTLFEQNISFDNWSMNSYVDNQPNHTIRNNLFFRHLPDTKWMWDPTDTYSTEKFRTCLSLSDEYASGKPAGTSAMANAKVYNNLFIGCRYGITDYFESTTNHGMKNDLIANNTIVMDDYAYEQENIAGIAISDNGANNTGTVIANNIVYRPRACGGMLCPLVGTEGPAKLSGITLKNNLYFAVGQGSAAVDLFATNTATNPAKTSFAAWQSFETQDNTSAYGDPLFKAVGSLEPSGAIAVDYRDATPKADSPARGLGVSQSTVFFIDFSGAQRGATWTVGALQ